MPFNVIPKASPNVPTPAGTSSGDARARAIAMLNQNQAPEQKAPETAVKPAQEPPKPHKVEGTQSPETAPAEVRPSEPSKVVEDPEKSQQPSPTLSSQYAQLARKEKALRAEAQRIKAEREAIKAEQEAAKLKEAEYTQKFVSKERISQDTLGVLNELGITYEELTNLVLNGPKAASDPKLLSEIKRLNDKISDLEGKTNTVQKTYEESQSAAYKQAIQQITQSANKLIYTDPAFETIKETNSVNDVVELIESTFRDGLGEQYPAGTLLSVEEAAQMVEDQLMEEAMKITRIKKIQAKLNPPAPTNPTVPQKQEPDKQQQTAKTLTNSMGVNRPLSARERAILAAKGELKS